MARRLATLALMMLALLASPGTGRAEEIVAALSQNRVAITTSFTGSEILVFGAIKRAAPAPEGPLHVIVTMAGPSETVTVRRKSRHFGIWVNAEAVTVESAPSFYALASTGPLEVALSASADQKYRITPERAIRALRAIIAHPEAESFVAALMRIRAKDGLYQSLPGAVRMSEDTLFRTAIALPADLTEGDYATRIFLTRGGEVIDVYETDIAVRKVGLERRIYTLAHEQPLIYGLLSLFIAIVAGWGASAAFRLVLRR